MQSARSRRQAKATSKVVAVDFIAKYAKANDLKDL